MFKKHWLITIKLCGQKAICQSFPKDTWAAKSMATEKGLNGITFPG